MRARPLPELARLLGGRIFGSRGDQGRETLATGAAIDSREVHRGDLFFAIRGERDGTEFASAAIESGAVAAVVGRGAAARVVGPAIEVDDPRDALGRLAAGVRREERDTLPAVAITGSVGKTTACGYVATLLDTIGPSYRPPESYNNDLGVPLTILGAPEETRSLVIEIGTNAQGEVAALAAWTEACVGVVTSIAHAHLEGLGSLAGIAREKLSLFDALPAGAVGWVPVAHAAAAAARGRTIHSFGPGGESEVQPVDGDRSRSVWRLGTEEREFSWPGARRDQRELLAAALGVGTTLGADPQAMLARVGELPVPPLRGEIRRHGGVDLLLDCYNANPASLEAAIERLEEEPATGRRLCVIGTMEELGTDEAEWHRALGRRVGNGSVDGVYLVGRGKEWYREGLRESGRDGEMVEVDDQGARHLATTLRPGDRVLFKASRLEALEVFAGRVAAFLGAEEQS